MMDIENAEAPAAEQPEVKPETPAEEAKPEGEQKEEAAA